MIEDVRRNGEMLRITWHTPEELFVVSHWRDNVCTAATRIDVRDAGALAGVLVDGLSGAVNAPVAAPPPPPPGVFDRVLERLGLRAA